MAQSESPSAETGQPEVDNHAHVRYFKLLEVAYHCAKNGYYERSCELIKQAQTHFDEAELADGGGE